MKLMDQTKLTFLSINDVYDVVPNDHGFGGLAELMTLIQDQQSQVSHRSLITVNGDFLSASEMGEKYRGKHMIDILNHIGIDFAVFGNHEFDYSSDTVRERMDESEFTWLGSNVQEISGTPFHSTLDHYLFTQDNIKFGLFGICTQETPQLSYPGDDVKFTNYLDCAKAKVHYLKEEEGVDVIIVLTHLSIAQDKLLAKKVPQINLILGGHDHEPFTAFVGETMVHKSGQNAFWLARIDMDIEKSAVKNKTKVYFDWRMIANRNITPTKSCQDVIAKYVDNSDASAMQENQRVLALSSHPLDTRTSTLRTKESNFGNLVADALRSVLRAEIGVINGGFIRGDRFYEAKTSLTIGMIKREMPFPKPAVLLRIRGQDMLEALTEMMSRYPASSGSFPHVSGLRIRCSVMEQGHPSIDSILLEDGEQLDLEKEYLVATSYFVARGGDGCETWSRGKQLVEEDAIANVVIRYLEEQRLLNVPIGENRLLIEERSI